MLFFCPLTWFILLLGISPAASQIDDDLLFVEQTLKDNHPGFYNDFDPDFPKFFESNFNTAREKLHCAETDDDKKNVLKELGRSFEDSHLWVKYDLASPQATQTKNYELEKLNETIYWITIPSFYPATEESKDALQQIIHTLPTLREKTLVFDLRGNRGGSCLWGRELINALFGEDYVRERLAYLYSHTGSLWRISPDNLKHMVEQMSHSIKRHMGENHPATLQFMELNQNIEKAFEQGEATYFAPVIIEPSSSQPALNPMKEHIFILIDRNCYSATLMFLDELKAMQAEVTLLGETTGADSMYMELRTVDLPSGLGKLGFPIRVYRGPSRGHNVPYHPDIRIMKILQNTEELKKMIIRMVEGT